MLKISERIINLAGVFGDSSTAGVYIKLLCRYCMPASGQKGLGYRHVQINKMILNTANCLGSILSFIKICSVRLAGLLYGKPLRTTLFITTGTNWVNSIFKLIGKVMCRFFMPVCSRCSLRVHHTRTSTYRLCFSPWWK